MDKYQYNDANPDYRVIKRTFYVRLFPIGKRTVIDVVDTKPEEYTLSTPHPMVAKCVFYSNPVLQGVLKARDKRVYLN